MSHKILKDLNDIIIEEMQVNGSQDMFVFLGCKLNQNKYDVYGLIDMINETVEIRHTENLYGNCLHIEKDIAYITDGEIPRKNIATGVVKYIDLFSKQFFNFNVDNLESTNACLSKDCSCLFAYSEIFSEDGGEIEGYLFSYNISLVEKYYMKTNGDTMRLLKDFILV